jgi:antitoxin (DNA-binding transcriptional repressor) of toxin-antitoxin stability system
MCDIGHMRSVTVRKLHEETGRLVDAAQAGEVIVIRRRGVPVAELSGFKSRRRKAKIPDFTRRYAKFPRVKSDSGKMLEEERR